MNRRTQCNPVNDNRQIHAISCVASDIADLSFGDASIPAHPKAQNSEAQLATSQRAIHSTPGSDPN
jgi:hypothetical protein